MVKDKITKNKRGSIAIAGFNSLYLPDIADSCNFEVKSVSKNFETKTIDEILELSPDFLVCNLTFQNFKPYMENLARLKELLPTVKIIVYGEPFLTYNTNVTYENPFIDYAIIGEPELTLKDILNGVPNSEILGICYTDDNMQSVKTEQRPFIENLDELPFPIRMTDDKNRTAIIEVSRGCSNNCFHCLKPVINGNFVRTRSPISIVNEIKEHIKINKIKHFIFKADYFNFNNDWVKELCNLIIQEKLKITWSCELIPKNLDNELVQLMQKSGLRMCYLSAESGSQTILNNIGKGTKLDEIKEITKLLKKHHIKIWNTFIIGLPWETEETINETTKFAVELAGDRACFNIAAPYPRTKFFLYSMLNKLTTPDIDFSNANVAPIVRTHKLSKDAIYNLWKSLFLRYYFNPKIILKNLFAPKSIKEIKFFIKLLKRKFKGK